MLHSLCHVSCAYLVTLISVDLQQLKWKSDSLHTHVALLEYYKVVQCSHNKFLGIILPCYIASPKYWKLLIKLAETLSHACKFYVYMSVLFVPNSVIFVVVNQLLVKGFLKQTYLFDVINTVIVHKQLHQSSCLINLPWSFWKRVFIRVVYRFRFPHTIVSRCTFYNEANDCSSFLISLSKAT